MKRTRQESAEFYEVNPSEIALALGLFVEEGDVVTLEHKYGDVFSLKVASVEVESVELEAPVFDPIMDAYAAAYVAESIPLVIIPPPLTPAFDTGTVAGWAPPTADGEVA